MKILLASNNDHKYREVTGIIRGSAPAVTVLRPLDLGFRFDCEETGNSFGENARIKANALWMLLSGHLSDGVESDTNPLEIVDRVSREFGASLPVLADDSGISVDFLDGAPGLFSARFGADELGPDATDRGRTDLLLNKLDGTTNRSAHYTCNAVLITGSDRYHQAQEIWKGSIASEYQDGGTGFGYDPVFWLESFGRTVAQLPQEQKDRISHRALAVNAVLRSAAFA